MLFNFDVRVIWRSGRTPLFHVTVLATLCIKGLTKPPRPTQPPTLCGTGIDHFPNTLYILWNPGKIQPPGDWDTTKDNQLLVLRLVSDKVTV